MCGQTLVSFAAFIFVYYNIWWPMNVDGANRFISTLNEFPFVDFLALYIFFFQIALGVCFKKVHSFRLFQSKTASKTKLFGQSKYEKGNLS